MATDKSNNPAAFASTDAVERDRAGLTFDADEVASIREMLLIGFASWGELERIDDELNIIKMTGQPAPDALRPIWPDASNDTVGRFVDAVRAITRQA